MKMSPNLPSEPVQVQIIPLENPSGNSEEIPKDQELGKLAKLSKFITSNLETIFENHGRRVASHPKMTIFFCFFVTALSCTGLVRFHTEVRPFKLWLSQDSEFIRVLNWQEKNFPLQFRYHSVLWEAENILTANSMKAMWLLHSKISSLREKNYGKSWNDVCALIQSLEFNDRTTPFNSNNDKEETRYQTDFSTRLDRSLYCSVLQNFTSVCLELSLLEIWGYNQQIIMNLTDDKVIDDVNRSKFSRSFGLETDFKSYLGDTTVNKEGIIVSAKFTRHVWITEINRSEIKEGKGTYDIGTGFSVDLINLSFEEEWVKAVLKYSENSVSVKAIPNAASSFGQVSSDNLQSDIKWVAIGFILMLIFVSLTIGKRNIIQLRILLSLAGLIGIIQSVGICFGICSYFNIYYTQFNSILPLLMVGLGVDDMFVIMATWENLKSVDTTINLIDRVAYTMKHAGVAITITSVTDVAAFVIGSTTALPALRSFCLYASVGILSVYFMQITFFLSMLTYDEKRIEASRIDIIPCLKVKNENVNSCMQESICLIFFKKVYNKFFLSTFGKVVIMLLSLLLILLSGWGTLKLSRSFNPVLFLPTNSFLHNWYLIDKIHFPHKGRDAFIYFSNITLPSDLAGIQIALDKLRRLPYIQKISPLFTDFIGYYSHHPSFANESLTSETFHSCLSLFLNSKSGAMYKNNFYFRSELKCHNSAPEISAIRLNMILNNIDFAQDQRKAKLRMNSILNEADISGFSGIFSDAFVEWETNEIVGQELLTNMIIVLMIVFFITLIFLASLWAAILAFCCVFATLCSIGGLMQATGLTIDTVSCIAIVLSIGLSVDYSVHVIHSYLTLRKNNQSKSENVKIALNRVGPAVIHGSISSLISFIIMGFSSSHVFQTFFKIFSGSATFGLYWGLVALPIILSIDFKKLNILSMSQNKKDNCKINSIKSKGVSNKTYSPD